MFSFTGLVHFGFEHLRGEFYLTIFEFKAGEPTESIEEMVVLVTICLML